jgi:hypothetical protein
LDQDPTAHRRRLRGTGQRLTGVAVKGVRRRGSVVEDAELDGDDADRPRLLNSSTLHQQQLLWWPESSRTRRRSRAEIGCFRGREEERRAGVGCSGGVCLLGASTGVFIASGGREQGDQRVASTGVLAAFGARSGHGGLGGVLGGRRLGCGRLCVCSGEGRAVGIEQRRR